MKEQQYVTSVEGQSMQRFGNYDLIRRLAVGGMGEVYLARQRTAFGREVAIKIIRPELIQDSITHQRFLREAKVSAHLKHEHILPLIEFNEEQGRLFLVTPYIEGGTLSARLQQGPISLLEVRQLFVALVQAVAYIHKSGVIHRDLKPSNILLDQGSDGQVYVRLIDFGIARLQGDEEESPQLTTDGIEVGTAEYMAPERLAGVAEPSNDIYSLGVILYLLLAGRLPSIKPRASIPPALDSIVYRCMALNPADRFASADELLKAFTQAYRQFNNPLFHVMNANVAGVDVEDAPTARGDWSQGQARLKQQVGPSLVSLENSGEVATTQTANPAASTSSPVRASHPSRPATGFERTDYDAPTSRVTLHPEVKSRSGAVPVFKKPVVKKNPARKSRGISLLAVFSVLIVLIILVIVGILALGLPSLSAVQVNIRPQEQVVNQVFQMTANPTSQKINVSSATIPATQLTETRSSSLKGPTTGVSCIIFCLGGHRTVSASDVDTLTAQLKQSLVSQITQDLQGQLRAKGALENSNMPVHFVDLSNSAVPPVGSQSDNVTVTLAEQGATEAVLSSDAQTLAKQLLSQRASGLGSNFKLVPSSIQIGQPVVTNIDPTGVVSLKVAAGGVAEYQFPPTQLRGMSEQLKGLSVKDATNFLKSQPGVDRSSVALHFTMGTGDALPTDPQQIKITPVVPVNLPTVQLTPVPTVALPTGQGTGLQGQSTPPPDQQLPTSTPGDN